jgi:hypothetical protein
VTARDLTDEELASELKRRDLLPHCPCGKWRTYVGIWDRDGYTVRCHGCLKAIGRCTCR